MKSQVTDWEKVFLKYIRQKLLSKIHNKLLQLKYKTNDLVKNRQDLNKYFNKEQKHIDGK